VRAEHRPEPPLVARRGPRGGEQGTSLVLALVFMTLVSVVVAGAIAFAGTSFQTARVARERLDQRYAADGGIDLGIRALLDDYSLCASPAPSATNITTQTLNGRTVTVTCQTLQGTSVSTPGTPGTNALTIKQSANPVSISGSSAAHTIRVTGPMFSVAAFSLVASAPNLAVTGELTQHNPSCASNQSTYGTRITATPWTCVPNTTPAPDPNPSVVVPSASAPASRTYGANCTIYYPGRYTSAPTFTDGRSHYLASGTYYFHQTGNVTLTGTVFGGARGSESQALTGTTPCADDTIAQQLNSAYSPAGSGVTIVLGGNSVLRTSTSTTRVELFSRVPAGADAGATPGTSIWARASGSGVSGYTGSTAATPLLTQGAANTVIIHGMVSLPDRAATIAALANADAAAGARAQLAGGAVLGRLSIVPSASSNGAVIAAGSAGTPGTPATERRVLVRATAASASGGTPTTILATVRLPAAPGGSATVLSWRTV